VCLSSGLPARVRRFRLAAIICGIDQVVLTFDPRVASRIERRHNVREGSLLDTLVDLPTARLASVGAISEERWLRYARQSLPSQAVDEWLGYHGTLNQPVVEILTSAMLAGARLVFLANSTARLWADLAHHDLGDLAEETFSSADIGYAKPDPRVYEHVIDAASLNPRRTLYVDSNPSWVQVGRQLGMRGHQYIGAAALREELLRAGARV
jgi:putative hydrolase of the HAD superfamily